MQTVAAKPMLAASYRKDREVRVGRVVEEKSPLQHGTSVTRLA